jgi:hypothetical protein
MNASQGCVNPQLFISTAVHFERELLSPCLDDGEAELVAGVERVRRYRQVRPPGFTHVARQKSGTRRALGE